MDLLPVLKPIRWSGIEQGALAHVWAGTPDDPKVVVAYAYVGENGTVFLPSEGLGATEQEAAIRDAFNNLERYESSFELVEASGGKILVSAGREFAAERALCQSHMLRAHSLLDAAEIVVSLARRRTVLACAYQCPESVKATMVGLHRESWENGGPESDRVLKDLVIMADGRKVRTIPLDADGQISPTMWN